MESTEREARKRLDKFRQYEPQPNSWSRRHLSANEPSPGFHVGCVYDTHSSEPKMAVFADGWTEGIGREERPGPSFSTLLPAVEDAAAIALHLMDRLQVPDRGPEHNAPAVYSVDGIRLWSAAKVLAHKTVFIFEGGIWIWPSVEVGFERHLRIDDGVAKRNVTLTTLSLSPRVLIASNFITESESKLIIERADGHMFKSGVSLKAADRGKASSEYRTSSQWSYPLWDESILALDRRVQQLTRIPLTHAEQIQVLRYMPFEHYTAHHDFFDPGDYGTRDREPGYANNRLATVFFYLNEPVRGGETGFPRAGKLTQPRDFLDCTRGIAVKPQSQAVLIFYSMLPNGEFDYTSLHAGCDVIEGVKWSANFWFWNKLHGPTDVAKRLSREIDAQGLVHA